MTELKGFPELRQASGYDCGASALQSVLAYYGIAVAGPRVEVDRELPIHMD
jgi:predicted double-glycine peptidase